jgi:hypothetical protein
MTESPVGADRNTMTAYQAGFLAAGNDFRNTVFVLEANNARGTFTCTDTGFPAFTFINF